MTDYRIRLKPLEPFCFGREQTFGRDDLRGEARRYFARSEMFPSQSALLGMLRKAILNRKGLMTLHRSGEWVDTPRRRHGHDSKPFLEAKRLVGDGKFGYESSFDTGVVAGISPLFVSQGDRHYFVDTFDRDFEPVFPKGTMMLDGKPQPLMQFKNYDAKEPPQMQFVSHDDTRKAEELFMTQTSVGIKKEYRGKTQDDAYFLKESFQLKDGAEFSLILRSDEDMLFLDKTLVSLGGDQSSFLLQVERSEPFDAYVPSRFASRSRDRVVFLSEAYLDPEMAKACDMILGERKGIRYLIRDGDNPKQPKSFKSKHTYYLFQRGTVVYTHDLHALQTQLEASHLRTVGLNHFITLQGDTHAH